MQSLVVLIGVALLLRWVLLFISPQKRLLKTHQCLLVHTAIAKSRPSLIHSNGVLVLDISEVDRCTNVV